MMSSVLLAAFITVGQLNGMLHDANVSVRVEGEATTVVTEQVLVDLACTLGYEMTTTRPGARVSDGLARAFVGYVREHGVPPGMSKGKKKGHVKSRHVPQGE